MAEEAIMWYLYHALLRFFRRPTNPISVLTPLPYPKVAQTLGHFLDSMTLMAQDAYDAAMSDIARAQASVEWYRQVCYAQTMVAVADAQEPYDPFWVPSPAEYEAMVAADVTVEEPAKPVSTSARKVRVYELAQEYGVPAKQVRVLLDNLFDQNTRSSSSSVTQEVADEFREFANTHFQEA